eukprot:3558276-Rhodomonas_salina.2
MLRSDLSAWISAICRRAGCAMSGSDMAVAGGELTCFAHYEEAMTYENAALSCQVSSALCFQNRCTICGTGRTPPSRAMLTQRWVRWVRPDAPHSGAACNGGPRDRGCVPCIAVGSGQPVDGDLRLVGSSVPAARSTSR